MIHKFWTLGTLMSNGCVKIPLEMVKKPSLSKASLHNFCNTRWKVNRLNLGGKAKI